MKKLIGLALFLFIPAICYAYIDPGTGALLWQVLAAIFLGLLFYVKKIWNFFKSIFHIKKESVSSNTETTNKNAA